MGKKSRRRVKADKPVRRPYVARTFEGLPGEADWVALREIVPAASATLALADGNQIVVASLLPGGVAGLVRPDGAVWLGLQVQHNYGDIGRDLAAVVEQGLAGEPGRELTLTSDPGDGPRLPDLVAPDATFDVTVHDGFEYWVDEADASDPALAQALEVANESVAPTVRLSGVEGAYWTQMGGRRFLRWVQPHDETRLLDALARLHAAGTSSLGEGTRLIGMFRSHALLVPVWDLDDEVSADDLEGPARDFADRLEPALSDTSDLTSQERSARSGLTNRQLTIR
ncbi:DUF5926 family protein [Solicola sp. PLA-1-18]|uniref:DUF5926 family protein n=1 Tax=Solicola sp. PLA-1-18 TaxID=3380532 RepID=UPI003B7EB25F